MDRIPLVAMGSLTETLERWLHGGLAKQVTHDRRLEDCLNLDLGFNWNWLPINPLLCPNFSRRVEPCTWGRMPEP